MPHTTDGHQTVETSQISTGGRHHKPHPPHRGILLGHEVGRSTTASVVNLKHILVPLNGAEATNTLKLTYTKVLRTNKLMRQQAEADGGGS